MFLRNVPKEKQKTKLTYLKNLETISAEHTATSYVLPYKTVDAMA